EADPARDRRGGGMSQVSGTSGVVEARSVDGAPGDAPGEAPGHTPGEAPRHTPGVIGIIGGSGLYELLDDARDEVVDTPYGAPSSVVSVGRLAGLDVAFVTRHGRGHVIAPHAINY